MIDFLIVGCYETAVREGLGWMGDSLSRTHFWILTVWAFEFRGNKEWTEPEMAWWVKTLASKSNELSSIPAPTHGERRSCLPQTGVWFLYVCYGIRHAQIPYMRMQIHSCSKNMLKRKNSQEVNSWIKKWESIQKSWLQWAKIYQKCLDWERTIFQGYNVVLSPTEISNVVILAAPHEIIIFEISNGRAIDFTLLNSGFLNIGTVDIFIIPCTVGSPLGTML